MVNKDKLWVKHGTLELIFGTFISCILIAPVFTYGIAYMKNETEIEKGVQGVLGEAMLSATKWCLIVWAIILAITTILFYFQSGWIEFTDKSIIYHRYLFSRKVCVISFDRITEIIVSAGIWRHRGEYEHDRKIKLYSKGRTIFSCEIYYKIVLFIITYLPDKRIRLIGRKLNKVTIDNYFKLNFNNLNSEQQRTLIKHYCDIKQNDETGEEILSKKKMLND